jgi:hypothetical protein
MNNQLTNSQVDQPALCDLIVVLNQNAPIPLHALNLLFIGAGDGQLASMLGGHFKSIYCVHDWNNSSANAVPNSRERLLFAKNMTATGNAFLFSYTPQAFFQKLTQGEIGDPRMIDVVYVDRDEDLRAVICAAKKLPNVRYVLGGVDSEADARKVAQIFLETTNQHPPRIFDGRYWCVEV